MRYYYRCPICLSTSTLEERRNDLTCVCGGRVHCLGPVTDKGRWLREELRPKCDGRCVSATGPQCDCQCHGQNHGKGLAGCVIVTLDGGAAVLRPLRPEEALRRAEEYRQAKAAVYKALSEVYGTAWDDYRAGRFIPSRATWEAIRFWKRELDESCAMLTHKTRIQRLSALAERIRKGQLAAVAR